MPCDVENQKKRTKCCCCCRRKRGKTGLKETGTRNRKEQ